MQLPTKSLKVRDEKDMDTRVFLNDQKFSDRVPNKIYVVSTCVGPPKKFQIFITIFVRSLHSFVIGSFYKKQGKNR